MRRSWFWRWFTILATAIMLPLQLAVYLPDLRRGFVTFLLVTVAGNFVAYCWMMMVYGSGAFGMFKSIWRLPWRDRPQQRVSSPKSPKSPKTKPKKVKA